MSVKPAQTRSILETARPHKGVSRRDRALPAAAALEINPD
jgi:hypothetical protein